MRRYPEPGGVHDALLTVIIGSTDSIIIMGAEQRCSAHMCTHAVGAPMPQRIEPALVLVLWCWLWQRYPLSCVYINVNKLVVPVPQTQHCQHIHIGNTYTEPPPPVLVHQTLCDSAAGVGYWVCWGSVCTVLECLCAPEFVWRRVSLRLRFRAIICINVVPPPPHSHTCTQLRRTSPSTRAHLALAIGACRLNASEVLRCAGAV